MAEVNPELQARLQDLDLDLQEGDITQKGYEKRRSQLLSQYLGQDQAEQVQHDWRLQSINEDTRSPDGSRASFTSGPHPPYLSNPPGTYSSSSSTVQPPSHVGRFQERQLHVRNAGPESAGDGQRLQRPPSYGGSTRLDTMATGDYVFNPENEPATRGPPEDSRNSTMLESQQGYFSDFAGQQMQEQRDAGNYGGPHRYSQSDVFSPTAFFPPPMLTANDLPSPGAVECQLPLEPREIPFDVFDPHNGNVPMSNFDNIGAVLRHRAKANVRQTAYWVLDQKGKEIASITWDKLHSRAEKVAQVIKDKSNLYRGDRVALVYRDQEVIEFAVALMGCFLAGVVAVPMNNIDDYQTLSLLLTTTQAHLALTTDNNLKSFHRDISAQRLKWPTGVEWWKTNEFGSYNPKRKDLDQSGAPDLAYIEFSRAPTGDLRGVVLSHRTIMHQMALVQAIVSTVPSGKSNDTFHPGLRDKSGNLVVQPFSRPGEVVMSYLDPREGIGLILGVLFGVYGGHSTVWFESVTVDTPGLYAHLITKYRTTIMVADYPGLKRSAYNYQQDPMATRNFKKAYEPNFSTVKICLIDSLTVDSEFHDVLADRWLRPMRNPRARELVAPMLCLPEHGGMMIAVRDWLGGEERMGCTLGQEKDESDSDDDKKEDDSGIPPNGYTSLIAGGPIKPITKAKRGTELSEVLLDKEALKTNEVVVLATGSEAQKRASEPGTLRAGAFGYPIADATLAVVDPEKNLLCAPYSVGEIWVDSPSLSGGFWALPRHTETIFHARPYRFEEGNPTPVMVEPEFLRTGLLGTVIEGKVYVLGLYEDRIRQRVEWTESGVTEHEHRYFFVQHLVLSIMRTVPRVYDCSAFDAHVNGEYLPIVLIETQAASTAPTTAGGPPRQLDIPFLDTLAERVMEALYQEHHLRVFCVMTTAQNTLPRIVKNGRREIGNMLCRRDFDNGSLACVHVKFGVEMAVQNLPIGDDPAGGIWSMQSAQSRAGLLLMQDKQYSGVDYREVVIDDRTSTPLNQFSNIHDLMQWRVSRQAEELAYCTIDGRGKEGKGVNWRKFDLKVAAVAMYLRNKVKLKPGDPVLLMYTHSEEFVYAIHACFCLGVTAIPMPPIDQNRLSEDAPALLHMISDFRIKALLVNHDVDHVLKLKPVSQHLKHTAMILRVNIPNIYNTGKTPKQTHGCRVLELTLRPQWVQPGYPALVWVFWTPDQRRVAVQMGHDTIMALCKVQKETCQMTSTRPVLGCVRSTIGLGFVHTCLMGIFLAAPTYLVSPVDFALNPMILFQTLSRYKIKDTYATSQMLDHAMAFGAGKVSGLHELKNLMISTDARPRVDVYQKVRVHFAQAGLDRTAINTIYSHVLNPMVTSRSYMCIEPIELWLDMESLRRGLVLPVDPDSDPTALLVQDSGMVPVSTQISIVNPETSRLCMVGEYGEIWVHSEANAFGFYGSKDAFDAERFNARTLDGDPNAQYVRTGDLGFLHNVSRPIGPGGSLVEMQILFILGNIGETFEVNGLNHFPMDIEYSVERCHRNIVPGGCAVFQAGGLVVVLVEIFRKNFLAALVPVIVNAVLNHHHFVVDIVAFVGKGDFPRSRLGEKQRGKILNSWVQRKIRSIAQFGIRDPDGLGIDGPGFGSTDGQTTLNQVAEEQDPESRNYSTGQSQRSSTAISSKEPSAPPSLTSAPLAPAPLSVSHRSGDWSVAELPENASRTSDDFDAATFRAELPGEDLLGPDDRTPTDLSSRPQFPRLSVTNPSGTTAAGTSGIAGVDYSPVDRAGPFASEQSYQAPFENSGKGPKAQYPSYEGDDYGPIESYDYRDARNDDDDDRYASASVGPLRVMNRESEDDPIRSSSESSAQNEGQTPAPGKESTKGQDLDDEWKRDALMHMNWRGANPNEI
ncbi:acetyl-CoA synthetase-like protein [Eremomyces bilateralis CBS 781.70]|uniref:Acetyl-CoA synthetase-like protein n=1 Tax=Eremomyces bilateralis CBS 781.70 TaxID=1392243 RepID=A0A6G1G1C2_9PEZI|nr:acetyl-CoA synthetase-like protein [Eremomyces bilateralis CBS 781.70]KAF1811818.1 acetyl-CoA synthetase-like protein [Eremomyces bilateralis CBS 781.70]